jgi:hypothetical protein
MQRNEGTKALSPTEVVPATSPVVTPKLTTESRKSQQYTQMSPMARMYGVLFSASIEAYATYPLDALKNREMMASKSTPQAGAPKPNQPPKSVQELRTHLLKNIIGPEYGTLNLSQSADIKKALRLAYRGSFAYWGYKVVNRTFKFGLQQPLMEAMMSTQQFSEFENVVGFDLAKVITATLAGSATGVAEVVINPVDRLKLICQKNNISLGAAFEIVKKEGFSAQYSAAAETAMRNAIGTGTLCFGKYATYYVMGVSDHNKPTWIQSLVSSIVGSSGMIVASHPFDLLKIRKQLAEKAAEQNAEAPSLKRGMVNTFFHIGRTEGPYALIAGMPAKLVSSGLKGALIMSFCELMVKEINKYFTVVESAPAPAPEKSRVPGMV